MTRPTGVVLMAYGTPSTAEEILPYYTDIRRGRPPAPEQLADLTRRYAAIGGLSPLNERTAAQAAALRGALGEGFRVELGMKHAQPSIEQAVDRLADCEALVGLVLAPHYSAMSVGEYHRRARHAAVQADRTYRPIDSWATLPAYVEFLAAEVRTRLGGLPAGSEVLFTAHSLPARIVAEGDRYPEELAATAAAVAAAAGLQRWGTAWQSAGRTPEPWLGPDVNEVIEATTAPGLLVVAAGFVADHLEVLYDLDIEARQRAAARGLPFERAACVNADPAVFTALAALVRER